MMIRRGRHSVARIDRTVRTLVLLVGVALAGGRPAWAQGQDPSSDAQFHLGPAFFTPTIALKEIGVDDNVFNASEGRERDFTWTLAPGLTGGLRMGRARLTGSANIDFVFFNKYTDQNSINGRYAARLEFALDRFRPWIGGELVDTRSRPGFEIDTRAQRTEPLGRAGVDVQLSTRTTFGVSAHRAYTDFQDGQDYLGTDLRRTLNRKSEGAGASVRYALTPLTTLVLSGQAERTRFDFENLRDANSIAFMPGFEFSPDAFLKGRASAGYRKFDAQGPGVPGYAGLVASVEVAAVLGSGTQMQVRVNRDVSYSFEAATPYYLLTGAAVAVNQHVFGPIDVMGSTSYQRLDYRAVAGSSVEERKDNVAIFGAGLGYRLGQATRIGATAEYSERTTTAVDGQPYDRLRVYASISYAFR